MSEFRVERCEQCGALVVAGDDTHETFHGEMRLLDAHMENLIARVRELEERHEGLRSHDPEPPF